MPLRRPLTNPPLATPAGVRFTLIDRSKLVHCLITHAGLEKLVRQALTVGDFETAFHKHRERIELTASRKYDASVAFYRPFTITPVDLVAYADLIPLGQPPSVCPARNDVAGRSCTTLGLVNAFRTYRPGAVTESQFSGQVFG